MSQGALFHESVHEALREVVLALGGYKSVGARMRPEMPADQAGRWLADCLNEARSERLSPERVVWMLREGRQARCHAGMRFLAMHCGYAEPVPVSPEEERARLEREFVEAARVMRRLAERIEATAPGRE